MSWLTRLQSLLRAQGMERDLDDELRLHIEMKTAHNIEAGMPPEEARLAALRAFGGVERKKEACRDADRLRFIEDLAQDVRYGLRQLRRNPGFTAVAVLTLALGIGANTAIFSLLDAVLLQSLPVTDPSRLVVFEWRARTYPSYHGYSSFEGCYNDATDLAPSGCSFSYPLFEQLRAQTRLFSGVGAFAGPAQLDLSGSGAARIVQGEIVSGGFFQTLGVRAVHGRTLVPADDAASAAPVAVLDYGYWQSRFGGSPSAVGKVIRLNGIPFTIVGVAAPEFNRFAPGQTYNLWLPITAAERLKIPWAGARDNHTNWWLEVIARRRPGISLARAQAAATLLFRDEMLRRSKPMLKVADDPAITIVPAEKGLVGIRDMFLKPLYVLMVAVGVLLLIACANVAGLLVARATTRQKEMAVRLGLGAGRARIVRQLLTESVLLSLAGGVLGVYFAYWGARSILLLVTSAGMGNIHFDVRPDTSVLAFTIAVSIVTGIAFGLAPAFRSTQVGLTAALKEGSVSERGYAGSHRFGLGSGLVVAQVALSMLVLAGAGLLARTLQKLERVNPGFDTRNLLLFGIDPTLSGYQDAATQTLYRNLEDRLRALPGVISASFSSIALLSGSSWVDDIQVEGRSDKSGIPANMLAVGPRFFETMRIPLLEGRAFTAADFTSQAPVAIVNRAFVRRWLRDRNPLGERFGGTGPKAPKWQIIGVAADAKYDNLRDAIKPTAYIPLKSGGAHFELRTAMKPAALIPAVRRLVGELDSNLPLFDVKTQTEQVDQILFLERLLARLSGLFALLALVLASVGLYGLLSYEVARRRREIGIRVALGAQRKDVLRLVVARGIILVLMGLGIGIPSALALTRFLSSFLYGVKSADPVTFIAVSCLLAGVALLACYIPARRGTKVDPMVALRYE